MAKEKGSVINEIPASVKDDSVSRTVKLFALVVGFIAFLLYLKTVNNGYVLDDNNSIAQSKYVQEGISGIPKLMTVDYWYTIRARTGYYRPLALVTFAVENQFFGNNPHVSHFNNALLYGLTGFLLFLLLLQLFPKRHMAFSFLICVLFVANPVHTEVVANIKSRDEILSLLNVLAMCYFAFSYTKTPKIKNLVWSLVFCYLALLSKETAVLGVALLALFFLYERQSIVDIFKRVLPYAGIIALFFLQKQYLLGNVRNSKMTGNISFPYLDPSIKIPSTFHIFWLYLQKLLIPWPLCYDYSFNQIPASHWADPGVWLGIVAFIFLVYFAFMGFKNRSVPGFSIAIIFITISPAIGFVFLRGGIMAERFLYAPSLGLAILLVYFASKLSASSGDLSLSFIQWTKKNMALVAISILIFSFYSFGTINRNMEWKNEMTLFGADVKKSTNSSHTHDAYGYAIIHAAHNEKDSIKKREEFMNGLSELNKAISIFPGAGDAYFMIGFAYQDLFPNIDSSIKYYKIAIETTHYADAYNNLGTLYQSLGKVSLASYYYNQTLLYNPDFTVARTNVEAIKKSTGLDVREFPGDDKTDPGIIVVGAKQKSNSPETQKLFKLDFDSGASLLPKGNYSGAIKYFEKAEKLEPENAENLLYLANSLGLTKNYRKSISTFEKLLKITPNDTVIMNNLAQTYLVVNEKSKSDALLEKVRKERK